MFSFLQPKHVKQGHQLLKDARKLLAYKRDLWSAATVADYEAHLVRLESAVRAGDAPGIEAEARKIDALCSANLPPPKDAWIAENVEVFLVAIVIALAVRTYFLQPFTIPTGSMQPTLNGIIGYPTQEPPPNLFVRVLHGVLLGRSYVNVVAERDCTVTGLVEFKSPLPFVNQVPGFSAGLFSRTRIVTDAGTYVVGQSPDALGKIIPQKGGFKAGEPIVRGYIETGDHVFVDKLSYHFRKPTRAEVFVFNTQNIAKMGNLGPPPRKPSQFYIKRLAGLPGDQLRIVPPDLFINGEPAREPAFRRVIDRKEPDYLGYSNGPKYPSGEVRRFDILGHPDIGYTVPPKNYFALGDNSFHSADSRDWGPVPEQNLVGRGVFVYWPFGKHWGLIK